MKIVRVTATPLNVPLHIKLVGARPQDHRWPAASSRSRPTRGIVGHGLTSITEEDVIAQIVNGVAGPAIVGDDPLTARARLGQALLDADAARPDRLRRACARRDRHRAVGHQGQGAEGQPVWRLLGGARDRAPVYATFGFGFFDREQLAAAAKLWVSQGFKRIKMTVGNEALRNRDKRPVMDVIREDAARVRAVREAVGPDIELYVDGNCNLDLYPRHQAGRDDQAARHRVLRGAADAERRAADGAAAPRDRHGAGLRAERGSGVPLPRSAARTRRWISCSPTSRSPAASRNACALRAWLRHSTCRWRTAAPGASTTCTCRPASRTARWSSTTISRSSSTSRSIAICRCRRMGSSRCRTQPGLGFEPNHDAIREIAKLPLSKGTGKG